MTAKIVPSLWFVADAAAAAAFYVSLFPGSAVERVTTSPVKTPDGHPVELVDFTLAGQPFIAMAAGPLDPFNHAISFTVNCADQAEIDRLWEALQEGGSIEQCGWLKDRYGVSWQIVPAVFASMIGAPDRAAALRATQAMLGMVKLDIAELQRAFDG